MRSNVSAEHTPSSGWNHGTQLPLNVQCPRKQHLLIGRIVGWEGVGRGIGLSLYLPGGTGKNRSAASLAADISNSGLFHAKRGVFRCRLPRCIRSSGRRRRVRSDSGRLPPGPEWDMQFSEIPKFRLGVAFCLR